MVCSFNFKDRSSASLGFYLANVSIMREFFLQNILLCFLDAAKNHRRIFCKNILFCKPAAVIKRESFRNGVSCFEKTFLYFIPFCIFYFYFIFICFCFNFNFYWVVHAHSLQYSYWNYVDSHRFRSCRGILVLKSNRGLIGNCNQQLFAYIMCSVYYFQWFFPSDIGKNVLQYGCC